MRRLILVISIAGAVACGNDSTTTTTAPSNPTQRVQVGGIWTMTETRTSVSGGECLEGTMNSTVGSVVTDTLNITQNGSSLTGVTTANANGVSCNWTGTADTDRFVLNLSSCQTNANLFGLRCANGNTRDLRIASALITAIISANGATYAGTKADTYNVTNAGTLTQVGTMTTNETVTVSK